MGGNVSKVWTQVGSQGREEATTLIVLGKLFSWWRVLWENQSFFLKLSEETFLLPELSLYPSKCKMYSFTLQWCCSFYRDKGKVSIKIHNTHHLAPVNWLLLDFEEHNAGCVIGLSCPLFSLYGLDSVGCSVLSPYRSKLMLLVSNPWPYPGFMSVVFGRYNQKMENTGCYLIFFFFFFFWLHWVFVAVRGLSLVAASGGYSVVVRGLLIAVASLVMEHGLWVHGLQ